MSNHIADMFGEASFGCGRYLIVAAVAQTISVALSIYALLHIAGVVR